MGSNYINPIEFKRRYAQQKFWHLTFPKDGAMYHRLYDNNKLFSINLQMIREEIEPLTTGDWCASLIDYSLRFANESDYNLVRLTWGN